MKSLNILMKW